MIKFEKEICNDLAAASGREWLETNGLGGFAQGTIAGANTRRYHCLLTAAADPPLGRVRMLSKIDETIVVDGERFEISTNRFPGNVHPRGFLFIESFRLDPFPVWRFNVGGVVIEKKIFMPHGENAVVCRWRIAPEKSEIAAGIPVSEKRKVSMELRPLLSYSDYHHIRKNNDAIDGSYESDGRRIAMEPVSGKPRIVFEHTGLRTLKTGHWYRDFEYAIEQERGFDSHEDLFQPFVLEFDLEKPADLIVSAGRVSSRNAETLEAAEIIRREELLIKANAEDETRQYLVLAADQFIVKRGEGHTVIAGYPWFSDWGRDTMIALNGLTLATNRPEIAREILLEYSKHISEGMIPNRFPDVGEEPEYNTVDATLWYFEAIRAYVETTGDREFLREHLYEKLAGILAWHLRGTRYDIHVDTDGLLYAGTRGTQLTWMDAKIGDLVVTPRIGKPVEIQALWYNALRIMEEYSLLFGDKEDNKRYRAMAELCKLSFNAAFWNEGEQCLFDVVINGNRDGSIRPNQLLAVSLKHSMVDDERARKIVEKAEAELLTPVGLRSLSPKNAGYCPIYIGTPFERDSAYHQGTVWGWLIGPFIDAYRRVHSGETDVEVRVAKMIEGFAVHLTEAGIGQISEIFDADAPHAPRGCPAQAWSIGELLRVRNIARSRR